MNALSPLLPYFFQYGYVAIFVILYFSAAYLPFPANIALIGAGALSHFSAGGVHFNIFLAAAVALAGNVLGDLTGYYVSRHFSTPARRATFEKKHKYLKKIEKYLKAHPFLTIGLTRLIGFTSPVVNTLAGFAKLRQDVFIVSDVAGNVLYTILYMGAGYLIGSAGENTQLIVGFAAGVVIVIGILYGVALYLLQER